MDELNKHQISEVIGCKESEVEAILLTRFGEQNIQYLAQLAKITQLSLKANRLIISQCLVTDDVGHVLCRFCGEGIPNWKQENSREHTAECPINHISTALMATKELRIGLLGIKKHEDTNPMPGKSI